MKRPFVLISALFFLSGIFFHASALACDTACRKKTARAIGNYVRDIEKAENICSNGGKGSSASLLKQKCEKELESVERGFRRFSDEIKNHPDIIALRERHFKIKDKLVVLDELARVEELVKPYERMIVRMEAYHCRIDETKRYEGCLEKLKKAEAVYITMQEKDQKLPEVVNLKRRYDDLVQTQQQMAAMQRKAKDEFNAEMALRKQFRADSYALYSSFIYLKKGREKKRLNSLTAIKKLDADLPVIEAFSANCIGKYAGILAKVSGEDDCELAQNAAQYRDNVVVATYKHYLGLHIEHNRKVIANLDNKGDIRGVAYKRLIADFDAYYLGVVNEITTAYASAKASPPAFDALGAQKAKLIASFNRASARNQWRPSVLFPVSAPLKDLAEKTAAEMGLGLVDMALSSDKWKIIKNKYGIPLRKTNEAEIVLKDSEESFYRIYKAKCTRTYDGNKYESASDISISDTFGPVDKIE